MNSRSDELYKASKLARDWMKSHWQKDRTSVDIAGRPYNPRVFEVALKKYEAIVDGLKNLGLPEYSEEKVDTK